MRIFKLEKQALKRLGKRSLATVMLLVIFTPPLFSW
jgi:hypothetical protein